jgi:site-specific recombinase XerD
MSWGWAEITKQEDVAGDPDPQLGQERFDERWVALVMLAKLKNSGTRNGYRIDINDFMDWWAHKRDPQLSAADRPLHATRTDLELFTAWLAFREPPLAASTQRRKIAVMSSFYALAERHELIVRTPLIGVSRPQVDDEDVHIGLAGDEADALLNAAERWQDEREGALVATLLLCGFRISEALGIRPGDITQRGRWVVVKIQRKGKDAKKEFQIDDDWLSARLLKLRTQTDPDVSVYGDIDRFAAYRIVAEVGRAAGLETPPHPHLLRHTFCAQLLRSGMYVRTVQKLAGHSSIEITQRYLDAVRRETLAVSRRLRRVFRGEPAEEAA